MTYRIRLLNFHCTEKIELWDWLQGENKGMGIYINTKKEQKNEYFCHFFYWNISYHHIQFWIAGSGFFLEREDYQLSKMPIFVNSKKPKSPSA